MNKQSTVGQVGRTEVIGPALLAPDCCLVVGLAMLTSLVSV